MDEAMECKLKELRKKIKRKKFRNEFSFNLVIIYHLVLSYKAHREEKTTQKPTVVGGGQGMETME